MSHRKSKQIRKFLFDKGYSIEAKPYQQIGMTIISSSNRRRYQAMKKMAGGL